MLEKIIKGTEMTMQNSILLRHNFISFIHQTNIKKRRRRRHKSLFRVEGV